MEEREGMSGHSGVRFRGKLGEYWRRDADEDTTGREGRIEMEGPRERRGAGPLEC